MLDNDIVIGSCIQAVHLGVLEGHLHADQPLDRLGLHQISGGIALIIEDRGKECDIVQEDLLIVHIVVSGSLADGTCIGIKRCSVCQSRHLERCIVRNGIAMLQNGMYPDEVVFVVVVAVFAAVVVCREDGILCQIRVVVLTLCKVCDALLILSKRQDLLLLSVYRESSVLIGVVRELP